ncbi:hypothetical protein C8J57DRAFT_1648477 [Mycena rebaudengoi]|nr:hypothetical protein C8J57DRAFT_1648477 [Mycena rebaudengoi]
MPEIHLQMSSRSSAAHLQIILRQSTLNLQLLPLGTRKGIGGGARDQNTDEERGSKAENVNTILLLDSTRFGGMQELWMNVVNSPGILHFDESTTGQRSFLKTRWRGSGDIAHAINLVHARRGRKSTPATPRSTRLYAAEGGPQAPHPCRAHASPATSAPSAISWAWTLVLHRGARTAEPPTFATSAFRGRRRVWAGLRVHRALCRHSALAATSARRCGPAWREHSARNEIAGESKFEEKEGGRGRTMTHERKWDKM